MSPFGSNFQQRPVGVCFFFSWTVVVRRFDGTGDFDRTWDEYKHGFGDASGEYWLGNEYLHYLTNSRAHKLRFDLEDWDGNTAYAEYSSFIVTSEADNYRLLLGNYVGNASDDQTHDESQGFLKHNNTQFSTTDRDNDESETNCVHRFGFGGFWYNACSRVTITNSGCGASDCDTLGERNRWRAWLGERYALKKMKMMFRPI